MITAFMTRSRFELPTFRTFHVACCLQQRDREVREPLISAEQSVADRRSLPGTGRALHDDEGSVRQLRCSEDARFSRAATEEGRFSCYRIRLRSFAKQRL